MTSNTLKTDFTFLIEENKRLIYKVAQLYCNNETDIEDLTQDIICNLWIAYPNFKNKSKISTWMYRIALNTAITSLRGDLRKPDYKEYQQSVFQFADENEGSLVDLSTQLNDAIHCLGKIDKAIMTLWLDNQSYEDIAEIVGLTKTNVATKINRIKTKLTKLLSNN